MPEFAYTARTSTGQDTSGVITAGSKRDVFSLLKERALFPVSVEVAKAPWKLWPKPKRIKAELLANNLTQLADLLQNGVSLMAALNVLVEQASQEVLAEVLKDVRDKVAEGIPFDQALARHPEIFGELAISMVRAGSEGAFLEDALKRTADFLEMQEEMKGQVMGAMAYPAFLGVAGTVVTIVLIVFFVHQLLRDRQRGFEGTQRFGRLPGDDHDEADVEVGLSQVVLESGDRGVGVDQLPPDCHGGLVDLQRFGRFPGVVQLDGEIVVAESHVTLQFRVGWIGIRQLLLDRNGFP